MMRSGSRVSLAAAFFIALLAGLLATPTQVARAVAGSVSTCDWTTFSDTLEMVQTTGGGKITFNCGDPATIVFEDQIEITSSVTISGGGVITLNSQGNHRLFDIAPTGSLTLRGLTIQNGHTTENQAAGGAIRNAGALLVEFSTFKNNSTAGNDADGGAIENGGTAQISFSTFDNNFTTGSDQALIGADGGAIHNASGATVVIQYSTLSNNFTQNDVAFGGAIQNVGVMTIRASTLTGNSIKGSITRGGAIENFNGTLAIIGSTIVGNRAEGEIGSVGGGIVNSAGTTTIQSSIVAGNTGNCFTTAPGVMVSSGYNLSNDAECSFDAFTDSQNATINLGLLDDNGGPTLTMLPLEGSDAIDGIPAADCPSATTERGQREVLRQPAAGDSCEIGAVELGDVFLKLQDTSAASPIDEGQPATLSVIATGKSGATLFYSFDCNDDDTYEIGPQTTPSADCDLGGDDGQFEINIRVSDDQGSTPITDTVTIVANNVSPTITQSGNNGPISEGVAATINVNASDPGGINDPLTYRFDCDDNGIYEIGPLTGSTAQCSFGDNGSYTVSIQAADDDGGFTVATTIVIVTNTNPVINSTSVNGSSPVYTVSVNASDAADPTLYPFNDDPLLNSFDCDGNGTYEVDPQISNSTTCDIGNRKGEIIFDVLVEDDDGGQATAQTEPIIISSDLCANRYNGDLRMPRSANCGGTEIALTLPQDGPLTVCVNRYNGDARYSRSGRCGGTEMAESVVGDGSFAICVNRYNGGIRAPRHAGQCGSTELADTL